MYTYADTRGFFRIQASGNTRITGFDSDGTIAWSNAVVGSTGKIQRAGVLPAVEEDWTDAHSFTATVAAMTVNLSHEEIPAGMALIPAGIFVMGNATNVFPFDGDPSEIPQHTVNISAFYMDQYEVTKALWDEVADWAVTNGYDIAATNISDKATNHPVQMVTWYEAVKWCNARSQRDALMPVYYEDEGFMAVYKTSNVLPYAKWSGNGYRLPTEAEWEKAARGGVADTRFPWTDYTNKISHAKANYRGQSGGSYTYDMSYGLHPSFSDSVNPYTSPVGYFAPNGYGLYDMAGNVAEWCWDWSIWNYYLSSPGTDPKGPTTGTWRVLRGGSWGGYPGPDLARCADRYESPPNSEGNAMGFRCARGM
jgi:formylglycine-generating enzyme required for sulfatase activity